MALAEPREILDLQDGGSLKTRILSHELGTTKILPRGATVEKEIEALRIHVPKTDKPTYPWYWDITGKTLKHQLLPLLEEIEKNQRTVIITKRGVAPAARFTVEVR